MSEAYDGAPEGATEETPAVDQIAEEDANLEPAEPGDGEEGEADPKVRQRQSLVDRNKELTWRLRETERREQALLDRVGQQPPAPEPQARKGDDEGRPDPATFTDGIYDPLYVEALTDWKAEQVYDRKTAESAQREKSAKVQTTFAERETEARAKHADYDEKVVEGGKRNAWACTPIMSDAIFNSEVGPDVAYHLASNPADARRIAALEPISQVLELGKIAATLTAPAAPPRNPATNAPPATPQVRGAGGRFVTGPRDDQSMDDWLAARNAELGR